MKKEALIVVKDRQTMPDGAQGEEDLEIAARGYVIYGDSDMYMLCYDETLDDGRVSHTTVTVKNGSHVSIVRKGRFTSELIVERGKRQNSVYRTPYGEILIGIYGKRVESTIQNGSGELIICYTIDYYGDVATEIYLRIIVTAESGKGEIN